MYTSKIPPVIKALALDLTWNKSRDTSDVYLTFDDGPTPGVTDQVLDILKFSGAKATFFCVGDMAGKSPELLLRIKSEGHGLGNHSMRHENGWKTANNKYFRSYVECQNIISTRLFRPPYGRISKSQAKCIQKRSEIIMWDVLPGDFDENASAETCLQRIKKNTQNGSIIVLHDSLKCGEKMLSILPQTIEWLHREGYNLKAL